MISTLNKAHIAAQSSTHVVLTDFESVIILTDGGTVYIPSPYLHDRCQEGQCRFGAAVALTQEKIYVGAPLAVGRDAAPREGAVMIYESQHPHKVLEGLDLPQEDIFYAGRAIAHNEKYIFIAASRNKDSGYDCGIVMVYDICTLQWLHTIEEVKTEETHSNFGGNIEVYKEHVAIEVGDATHRYALGTWELLP